MGWWWCHGCGGGWLSFGSKMFVAVVGSGVRGCSGFRCVGFESMIDWLGWEFGPMVVSWLWRWLVEFWASDICGYSGSAVFVEDFEFLFLFIFFFVEVFGFGICWRSSDCDCSLWRLICRCHCHWWFVEVDCDCSLMCWNLFNII